MLQCSAGDANVSSDPLYTIQPVVKPVEQPAASCKQTFNRSSNRLFNRFDNRLYRVNGVSDFPSGLRPTRNCFQSAQTSSGKVPEICMKSRCLAGFSSVEIVTSSKRH